MKKLTNWILFLGFIAILSTLFAACNDGDPKDEKIVYPEGLTRCDSLLIASDWWRSKGYADRADSILHVYNEECKPH